MRLTVKHNLDQLFADLEAKVASRLPIAVAIALNQTAGEVWKAEQDEMERVFDRPSPYTLKSVRYTKATPQKPEAEVYLHDESSGGSHVVAEYLIPQISGGVRAEKRSEWILRRAGILPEGMNIVPARSAPRDAYGNLSPGLIQQILSALRVSEMFSGHTSNRPLRDRTARQKRQHRKQGDFFVAQPGTPHGGHLHPGIYRRRGSGGPIEAIMLFVSRPSYRGIFEFEQVAMDTAESVLTDHLREQIAISVAKAG